MKTVRQLNRTIKKEITLENTNVPTPAPQTVTPVAKARSRSKYIVTMTIAGQYINPNPVPMTIPTDRIRNSIELALYDIAHLNS